MNILAISVESTASTYYEKETQDLIVIVLIGYADIFVIILIVKFFYPNFASTLFLVKLKYYH